MSKAVLFQVIQFSISTQFSSIGLIDRTLSGATTPGHSEHGNNDNEGVFHISQSSSITGTLPSDCLVSYPGHSLVSVFSLCRGAVDVFYSPSRLGNDKKKKKKKKGMPYILVYKSTFEFMAIKLVRNGNFWCQIFLLVLLIVCGFQSDKVTIQAYLHGQDTIKS